MSSVTAPATFPGAVVVAPPLTAGVDSDRRQDRASPVDPRRRRSHPTLHRFLVGGSGSVVLCGWQATDSAVPAGSTITGVQLQIAHFELPCPAGNQQDSGGQSGDGTCRLGPSFSDPGEIQDNPPGQPDCDGDDPCINGTIKATVSVGGSTCDSPNLVSSLALGAAGSNVVVGCNGALLGATDQRAVHAVVARQLSRRRDALPVAQAFLDGIVMTISYNTPVIQPGTGCIVTAANPCPAFSTVLFRLPSLRTPRYSPTGARATSPPRQSRLNFNSNATLAFDRGLIASQVSIGTPPTRLKRRRARGSSD